MSKAVKLSIFILVVMLIISLAFAGYSILESQKSKKESADLTEALRQSAEREKKAAGEIKKSKEEIAKINSEKDQLTGKIQKAEKAAEELYSQITEISQDRDNWKNQIDSVAKERDDLVSKIKTLEEQLAKKQEEVTNVAPKVVASTESMPQVPSESNDQYWATILKEKAGLEVKLDNLNQELTKATSEIVDLKQNNADLTVKLEGIIHDKDELAHEIQYKSDMVNNLSLELARTKNDKKFTADRVNALNQENAGIRQQLKQLVMTKGALEKSILRISQDRNEMQRKLGQTETMVQSKIDEIWDIKESLDQSVESVKSNMSNPGEVELPPIVVSSDGQAVDFNPGMTNPGLSGKVVSLNKENNFAIVDIGESQGIRVGDTLNVYRDSKYIARLEVIQVRKDISAADIKDQWTAIEAGDSIK